MTSTNAHTHTETFSRILGIRNQFKIAFERLMDILVNNVNLILMQFKKSHQRNNLLGLYI